MSEILTERDTSRNQLEESIFQSFWMGGFECSTHRLPRRKSLGRFAGQRLDLIAATRHDEFALQDYERLQQAGIRAARDGVRWHLIEKTASRYDFSSLVPMLRAAHETRTQIIWDLLHYGWPDGLNIWGTAFVDRFARFVRATAAVMLEETGGPLYVTPVNEISFVAWGGGDAGFLNPFGKRRGPELKAQLVRASIAAIEAVREVDPSARIIHAEPIIHIATDPDYPEEAPAAEAYRQSQFQAWDMIAGRLCPELGGRPEYLDILGANYYSNNQWIHQDPHVPHSRRRKDVLLPPSHPLHRPVREMLGEVYERYRRGDNRHCYAGLWDYADDQGHREMYEPLATELDHQERLWELQLRDHRAVEEAVNIEEIDEAAREVDVAASRSRTRRRE
jgi:hypothetical protein